MDVKGPDTHPVYRFLRRELPEALGGGGGTGEGVEPGKAKDLPEVLGNRRISPGYPESALGTNALGTNALGTIDPASW